MHSVRYLSSRKYYPEKPVFKPNDTITVLIASLTNFYVDMATK
ncbi:hypothetical protein MNB_SUP05-SYMBIONT-4-236 [hydrothermal vent metagenome]|uniref:Uncharacterized protein n=1 Tax=hydrothermal vent metagenome TaxID=652676 RepID=A0A1W1DXH6_9ZZZZ